MAVLSAIQKRFVPETRLARREALWGLFFISPWLVGFLIFTLAPMSISFVFTFHEFELASPDDIRFIGLDNWDRLLHSDQEALPAFEKTFRFGTLAVCTSLSSALLFAMLLNTPQLYGRAVFRALVYMPSLFPAVASTLIWQGVFNEYTGWVNLLIEKLLGIEATGTNGLRWTQDPSLIYIALTAIGLWGIGNAVIIFLAGLQGVPVALYEAATVDGASWWRRLVRITLPMISPVMFYQVVLSLIAMLQYFLPVYVLTSGDGSPQGSTRFIMVWFYRQAFTFFHMGYGATLAWALFIVAMILTLLVFGSAKYWVYYEGGEAAR